MPKSFASTHRSHWPLSLLGGSVSLLNLLLPLVLVRLLTPTEVGHYKIFFLYLVLAPWFCLTAGVTNGLGHWAGREGQRLAAFRTSWTLLLSVAGIALIAGQLLEPRIADHLEWSHFEAELFVWGAFVTILASFYEEASISSGAIWRGALFSSGFELVRNLTILLAAFIFRRVEAVFAAHVAIVTVKAATGAYLGWRAGFQRLALRGGDRRAVLAYALPVSLSAAFAILTNYTDQLVLSEVLPASEFAIYALGCLVVPPLFIFEQSVNKVMIPRLSRAFADGRGDDARRLYREGISELSWIMIPAAAGLSLFAEPIVSLLFTAKYIEAAKFLRFYAFVYVIYQLPYDVVARARGNGGWILRQLAFFSMLTLFSGYFAAKSFGAMGALLAALASQLALRMTAMRGSARNEGWKLRHTLPFGDWSRYAFFAAAGSIVAWGLKDLMGGGLGWFIGGGALFTVIYMLGTVSTFIRRRAESAERPTVLLLTQYLGLGGLERMILNLGRGLQQTGRWEPVTLVYDEIEGAATLHGEFTRSGIPVVTLQKRGGISLLVVALVVREIFRRRVAVVHSHDLGALIYGVLAKFATLGAVRVVHTQHSFIHLDKAEGGRYRLYERFFSLFADRLSTVSEGLRAQYPSVGVATDSVGVIPNGVEFPGEPPATAEARLAERRAQLASQVSDGEAAAELTLRAQYGF